MADSARKQRLAQFLDDVWGAGDVSAVPRYVAERYTIHNDPGDPWDGQTLTRDGFRARLVASRAVAPDQRFEPVRMVEQGDTVAVAWRWRGTHTGAAPGLPQPTGRVLTMTGATFYDFDADDQLTGHWQIADRLGVYRQMTE
ncbi:MAG: ester cyclase [Pseudooceanicola sp.]|nr:ester cyclase [Pseudooceanicola sp.]